MNESKFINSIDANFPYFDKNKWEKVILQGVKISDNAIFAILHEICRPPMSVHISVDEKIKIYNFVIKNFKNKKIFEVFLKIIFKIIKGQKVLKAESISAIRRMKEYPSLHSLLSILYFSTDDVDNSIEEAYNNVLDSWANKYEK